MSIATITHEGVRREQSFGNPEALVSVVSAGLVMLVFIGLALAFQTAALLIPGLVFFLSIGGTALLDARSQTVEVEEPDFR